MLNKMMRKLSKGTAIVTAAACMMTAMPVHALAADDITLSVSCEAPDSAEMDIEEDFGDSDIENEAEDFGDEDIVEFDDTEDFEEDEENIEDSDLTENESESDDEFDDLFEDENADDEEALAAMSEEEAKRRQGIDSFINGLNYDPDTQLYLRSNEPQYKKCEGRGTDDEYIVLTRQEKSFDTSIPDIGTIAANMSVVYPGALLSADSKLADGQPNSIPVIDRAPIELSIDINGAGDECTFTVDNPTIGNVRSGITKALNEWSKKGYSTTANINYDYYDIYSESQLSAKLGINAKKLNLGIDFENINQQKEQCVVLKCSQIYYNVNTSVPALPSMLFGPETTADSLKAQISNEKPPVEVTNVSYGRVYYVVFKTTSKSNKFKEALNAVVKGVDVRQDAEYNEICQKTSVSGVIIGGTAKGGCEALAGGSGLDAIKRVNKLIVDEADFKDFESSAAYPIAYKTTYVKNGIGASVNMAAKYVETTAKAFTRTHVKIDTAYGYALKEVYLKASKIIGWDDNGNAIVGAEQTFFSDTYVSRNKEFDVPAGYTNFRFGYDIAGGSDWPYRGIFYRGLCNKILIDLGGTSLFSSCKIKVDDKTVVNK